MLDEYFMAVARMVREESFRAGIAPLDEEDAAHIYAVVFTYAASSATPLNVVQVGVGIGYLSLWVGKALEDACNRRCRLLAIEPFRRYAERAATILHKFPFQRVDLRIVHAEPVRLLSRLEDSSVDAIVVDAEAEIYPVIVEKAEEKLVAGGVLILSRLNRPNTPTRLYELLSKSSWRFTVVPTVAGLGIAVRVG